MNDHVLSFVANADGRGLVLRVEGESNLWLRRGIPFFNPGFRRLKKTSVLDEAARFEANRDALVRWAKGVVDRLEVSVRIKFTDHAFEPIEIGPHFDIR